MILEITNYLNNIKPVMKKLVAVLQEEFNYVSILGTDCRGKRYRVGAAVKSVEPGMMNERGFVVRVHNGINYSEYSFNELSEEGIDEIVNEVKNSLMAIPRVMDEEKKIKDYDILREEEIFKSESFEIYENPIGFGDDKIMEHLTTISNKGKSVSGEVIEFVAAYEYLHINKIFISTNKDLEQSIMWSNATLICAVNREGKIKYSHKATSGAVGVELIDELEDIVEELVKDTVELLDSTPIIPGEYDVICTPEVTGLIAHEAFGHGIEMDMFVKDRAKSKEYFGEFVASPLVTMIDGASALSSTGSFVFDDEGALAGETVVIENGILKEGFNDAITALHLGKEQTGNGRRESFERKAYTRMTNTFFAPGDSTLEKMIESIDSGYLLDSAMNGMEDPKNWGIQCMLNIAREIKNGKLTGRVYSPIILTGYVPDLLKSITMVSKELSCEGAGFCGKGHKEWVKVSCGGPYIKCKARLG